MPVLDRPETTELDPMVPVPAGVLIGWEISGEPDHSPAAAAAKVWQNVFGRRGRPTSEEACVFEAFVGGRSVTIDLSEDRFAHLFSEKDTAS